MGLFYTTFTTLGPNQAQVIAAFTKMKRVAFVSPTLNRYTVIYDRTVEDQDIDEIEDLGKKLSKSLSAPVLAAMLHDDDVLYLWLFTKGKCRDFYNSLPQYFDPEAEPGPPEGGDGGAMCEAFENNQKKTKTRVNTLLRANLLDDELPRIHGELERHQALIKAFGMPAFAAEVTFSSIEGRYLSDEFKSIKFAPVSKRRK